MKKLYESVMVTYDMVAQLWVWAPEYARWSTRCKIIEEALIDPEALKHRYCEESRFRAMISQGFRERDK